MGSSKPHDHLLDLRHLRSHDVSLLLSRGILKKNSHPNPSRNLTCCVDYLANACHQTFYFAGNAFSRYIFLNGLVFDLASLGMIRFFV